MKEEKEITVKAGAVKTKSIIQCGNMLGLTLPNGWGQKGQKVCVTEIDNDTLIVSKSVSIKYD